MRLLPLAACGRCACLGWLLLSVEAANYSAGAQSAAQQPDTVKLLGIEGKVEVAAAGTTNWVQAKSGQTLRPGDLIRTDKNSRALLQSSRLGELRVRES